MKDIRYERVNKFTKRSESEGLLKVTEHAGRFFLEQEDGAALRLDRDSVVHLADTLLHVLASKDGQS